MLAVVVVPSGLQLSDGSVLPRSMRLPERGVPLAVRVPETMKGWLTAGFALEVIAVVMLVGVMAPTVRLTEAIA